MGCDYGFMSHGQMLSSNMRALDIELMAYCVAAIAANVGECSTLLQLIASGVW